jgi:hypothetical protein
MRMNPFFHGLQSFWSWPEGRPKRPELILISRKNGPELWIFWEVIL